MRGAAVVLGLVVAVAGCRGGKDAPADGASDAVAVDAIALRDALSALSVDFTVAGCPRLDVSPSCSGRAPLTLQFVPVTSGVPTRYEWDFGDGPMTSVSTERTPTHTFALPGRYDVKLVAVRGGEIVVRRRVAFVVATASGPGESCDVPEQCAAGLMCLCGSKTKCTPAFGPGRCLTPCGRDNACASGTTCADLSAAAGAGAVEPEPWARALCLPICQSHDDCPAGTRCRLLPGVAVDWTVGCFPAYPGDVGAPCRGANGKLNPSACTTGVCADLGANGLCSLDCGRSSCPIGSACADFADGRKLCLLGCGAASTCNGDPLLACTTANAGPLGFSFTDGDLKRYCAPRPCGPGVDCGAAGTCIDNQDGAHCTRRKD